MECIPDFYYLNGQCLKECPAGFYNDVSSSNCTNCPELCLTCNSGIFSFFLSFFFPFFIWSLLYLIFTFVETICLTCTSKYSLFGGKCIENCPDGFNSNNGICSRIFFWTFNILFIIYYFIYLQLNEIEAQKQTTNRGLIHYFVNNSNANFLFKKLAGLGVGLTFGLLFLILIGLLTFFFIKRQKKKNEKRFSENYSHFYDCE